MIQAGLELEGAIDRVVTAFGDLPEPLRPVHFSHGDKLASDADRIADQKRLLPFVAKSRSGFLLLGPRLTYSVRIRHRKAAALRLLPRCRARSCRALLEAHV